MLLEISGKITPERMDEPKQKQYPVVDVTSDRSKVWCCKEQYCIGNWNVRSMNQGKLEVVRHEMARVNIDILGIRKLTNLITRITALSNSIKQWTILFRATQDGWIMVESSGKTWSTGKGNGKAPQYSCLENPTNSMKRQNERTLKDELPRSAGVQYATGEEWRNNSRKNEEIEPKQKPHPVVDVMEIKSSAVKSDIA